MRRFSIIRRLSFLPILCFLAIAGCSSDSTTGVAAFSYALQPVNEDVSWTDASEAITTSTKGAWVPATASACLNPLTASFLPSTDGNVTIRGRIRARVVSGGTPTSQVSARILAYVDPGTGTFGPGVEVASTAVTGAAADQTVDYRATIPIGAATAATIKLVPEVMVADAAAGSAPVGEASCVQTTAPWNKVAVEFTPPFSLGQDSSATLGLEVTRSDNADISSGRVVFTSGDNRIATVDGAGVVTALGGGSTTITATVGDASVEVPVTVRPRPATSVHLTILTGPAGGFLGGAAEVGTFYALPADPATSRLKGVVTVGNDTVFCNYCPPRPTGQPPRVMRLVRFRSLNPSLATVNNANIPNLQTSTDTTGRVTPLDSSSIGAQIVMEVPGDSGVAARWADTVLLRFPLRPLDSLRIRPDSNLVPTANGTGLSKQVYPNADSTGANVVQSTTTNFIAGIDFLSRVQDIPAPPATALPTPRWIPSRLTGGATVRRPSHPNVTWESANIAYLTVNAAGAVVGQCAFIGGNCPTTGASVLTCTSSGSTMPQVFGGLGNYTVPSCAPTPRIIPMPGLFCTSASTTDLASTCTVWIRATATDPGPPPKTLRTLYRINIRR